MIASILRIMIWTGALFAITACSQPEIRPKQSVLDTPAHHVQRGREFIQEQRWEEARREFRLALEMDPEFTPALAGKAIVIANASTKAGMSGEEKALQQREALDALEQALDDADTVKKRLNAHVAAILVYHILETEDWLEEAEEHFEEAVELQNDNLAKLQEYQSEAFYYMANAYKKVFNYSKATELYRRVLELNGSFTKEANLALETLDKVIRAQPGTRHGKQVALVEKITRADLAALLIEELDLPALYSKRNSQKMDLSFQEPTKAFKPAGERIITPSLASDIEDHPLRSDIEEVLRLGIRGLEASPQHLFYPHQEITRAEYAIMLEDILIQVTQETSIATKFIGESSPWGDVREDAFYYNAARTLVSRSIMDVVNRTRGLFGPLEPVSGADALISIRMLKDELQSYVKSHRN